MSKLQVNFIITAFFYFENGQFMGAITIENLKQNLCTTYTVALKMGGNSNADLLLKDKIKEATNIDLYYLSDARANSIVLIRHYKDLKSREFDRKRKEYYSESSVKSESIQPAY